MPQQRWVDYSGAAPILLPVSIMRQWRGFYLPARRGDNSPDLELPEGSFRIHTDFNFSNPKTDYERVCALGGDPAVQAIKVGAGEGLVFATELDRLTWAAKELMLVNGGSLPDPRKLALVQWADELLWATTETDFVLLNACDHGAAVRKQDSFRVRIPPGQYVVQWGSYGWKGSDPALVLFRFVLRPTTSQAPSSSARPSRRRGSSRR
jgi:hypothetical protein